MAGLPLFENAERLKFEQAVDALAGARAAYLEPIRAQMREMYFERARVFGEQARVTPDDARLAFEAMNPPADMSRNFLAAVFRESGWAPAGKYISKTSGSHGNELNAYAWKGLPR